MRGIYISMCKMRATIVRLALCSCMRFLVASEIARCAEGLEAAVAGVGLVLDMGHPVVIKVGAGSEAFSTGLALVRPFPGVNPSVCVQGGAG